MTKGYVISKCADCALEHSGVCHHPALVTLDGDGARAIEDRETLASWCPLRDEAFWLELDYSLRNRRSKEPECGVDGQTPYIPPEIKDNAKETPEEEKENGPF